MNKEKLLANLEYWRDCLENPAYNSLEVGFRHSPLSKDEIIERYAQECQHVRESILRVIKDIENE